MKSDLKCFQGQRKRRGNAGSWRKGSDNYLLNLCPFWLSLYSVLLCHVAPDLCSWATHPSLVGRCVPPLYLKVALSLPSAHTLNAPLPSTSHTLQHSRYFQHQEGEAESRCTDLYQFVSHQNSLSADAGVCCKSMFTVMLFKERQNQELELVNQVNHQ